MMRASKKSLKKREMDIRWSIAVKVRDSFRCRWCDRDDTILEAAHIVPRRYIKIKYDIDNGLTLCRNFGCVTHEMDHSNKKLKEIAQKRMKTIVGERLYKELWKKAKSK